METEIERLFYAVDTARRAHGKFSREYMTAMVQYQNAVHQSFLKALGDCEACHG